MIKSHINYSAYETAIYLLGFKDQTKAELYTKLSAKGYIEDEIKMAVDKLSDMGYVDDARYASSYIRCNLKRKGIRLIIAELERKGISSDDIDLAMEDYKEICRESERKALTQAFEKRFRDADIDDPKTRNKVISYFVRRGYTYSDVYGVIKQFENKCREEIA